MEHKDAILIILTGALLGAGLLTLILLDSFGFFKSKKETDDEIEANAMVSPPPLSSDNTLANNHAHCCCKQHKQPNLPVKRAKHISEQ